MKKTPSMICSAMVALTLLATSGARAAELAERLDNLVTTYSRGSGFMGAVLVAKGDKVLFNKGYGAADLEWSIPNTPEVKFRLGSLTKQFTSALILLLQQDGKLDIDDAVGKHLPDAPAAWRNIKVRNLLDHTSGIPNFTDDKDFEVWSMTPRDWSKAWRILDKPLAFEPGAKFSYSNSNYELLGLIVERVGGAPYAVQLRARLLDPLGLRDTGLDEDGLILSKRAQGYTSEGSRLVSARSESMSVPWAAGSMYATTGDLLKWETALFSGRVLAGQSLKLMTTVNPVSVKSNGVERRGYALGVGVAEVAGERIVRHSGGIEGFNTALAHAVNQDVTVVVLANKNGDEPDKIADALMKAMLETPPHPTN